MQDIDIRGLKKFFRNKLNVASHRDKPKNIEIDEYYLVVKYFEQKGKCAITNRELTFIKPGNKKKRVPTNCSIDRIDSSEGYVPGNVHLVCGAENIQKNRHSLSLYKKFRSNSPEAYEYPYKKYNQVY
jgi:hypothetical protein